MQTLSRGTAALLLFSVAAPLAAQPSTLVSPAQAAAVGTTTTNAFPFNSTTVRRYLQLHGDLGVGPKSISQLRFRQPCGTGTGGGSRTMLLDMWVGTGRPVQSMSFAFDANYTAPKTQVMTQQTVNWGPIGAQTACPAPSPFESAMSLPISQPFAYLGTGANSFIWEVAVFSNTGSSIPVNTHVTTNVAGTSTVTAAGCGTMTHGVTAYDHGGILSLNFTVTAGPGTAPTVVALGSSNPNLSVPGLCSPLLTDLVFLLPVGMTLASGAITTTEAAQSTLVMPNAFAGATLFTQAHSLDVSSSFPIQVRNSNGRSTVIPAQGTNPGLVARVVNNAGGTTATSGVYFSTSTVGYGLVTEITYQ